METVGVSYSCGYLVISTVTKATLLRYAPKGAKMHSKYDCLLDNVVLYVEIVQNSQELLKFS